MHMRGRILRLEKLAGAGDGGEEFEAMIDSELRARVQAMFRADPDRRWEDAISDMGDRLSQMLEEARAEKPVPG